MYRDGHQGGVCPSPANNMNVRTLRPNHAQTLAVPFLGDPAAGTKAAGAAAGRGSAGLAMGAASLAVCCNTTCVTGFCTIVVSRHVMFNVR